MKLNEILNAGYEKIGSWDFNKAIPKKTRDEFEKEIKRFEEGDESLKVREMCFLEHVLVGSTAYWSPDPFIEQKSYLEGKLVDAQDRVKERVKRKLSKGKEYLKYIEEKNLDFSKEEKEHYLYDTVPEYFKKGEIIKYAKNWNWKEPLIMTVNVDTREAKLDPLFHVEGKPNKLEIEKARGLNKLSPERAKKRMDIKKTFYDWISLGEKPPYDFMFKDPYSDLINITEDISDNYRGGYSRPFIQNRVNEKELRKAYDFLLSKFPDYLKTDEQKIEFIKENDFNTLKEDLIPYIRDGELPKIIKK